MIFLTLIFIDDVNSNHWNNFFGIKRLFFSETTSDFKFRLFKQRLKLCTLEEKSTMTTFCFFLDILGMEEILHQLIGSFPHYLQGVIHPRWCRISSINSMHQPPPEFCTSPGYRWSCSIFFWNSKISHCARNLPSTILGMFDHSFFGVKFLMHKETRCLSGVKKWRIHVRNVFVFVEEVYADVIFDIEIDEITFQTWRQRKL